MTATKIQPVAEICSASHDDAQFGERAIKPLCDISIFEYGTPLYAGAAPAAVAPQGTKFFSASNEGLDEHDTAEAAQNEAQSIIDMYREEAADGWPEEVDSVCWGVILGKAVERPVKDAPFMGGIAGSDMEPVDYVLEPVAAPALEAPAAPLDDSELEDLAHSANQAPAAPDEVLCYIRTGATLPERHGFEVCRATDAGAMAVMGDGRVAAQAEPASKRIGQILNPAPEHPQDTGSVVVAEIMSNGYNGQVLWKGTVPPVGTLLYAAPEAAPAAPSALATQVIENLLQLARIVNTAVEDWGETKEDDSLKVIFHKEEADKMESILEFFDSLPDAPAEEGVIESGPLRAARVLRAQAAPAAPAVDAQPLIARSIAEWHEDDGDVSWWAWCGHGWAGEPAWIGRPTDDGWPGYHTHWTAHPAMPPAIAAQAKEGGAAC